jgi:2-amino-4-deoxychorismate synthase
VLAALGLLPEPTPAPTLPPGTDAGPEAVAGSTPTPPPGADAQPEGLTAGPDDITGPAGTAVTDLIIRREHPAVARALAARNDRLAEFWLRQRSPDALTEPALAGHDALVVDAEDSFTGMLAHLLRALGMRVRVLAWHRTTPADLTQAGLLIAGPGPGDPTDPTDPRMLALRQVVDHALGHGQPLLGVCLGHQVLAGRLGLAVSRRLLPCQGLQREIDFFGTPRRVGFYSSFTAHGADDVAQSRYGPVLLSRDATDGAVHALRGARFAGVQFHPESVLSPDGVTILRELLTGMVVPAGAGVDRAPAD